MPTRSPKPAQTYIALLRGINVGGNHMIPMSRLAPMFTKAGAADVRTYIQSGNVIFSAPSSIAKEIPAKVSAQVNRQLGYEPHIILRTSADVARIAASNPLFAPDIDHKLLHVGFLATRPTAQQIAKIDPGRSPHDRFTVQGSEIYIHYAKGILESKLTGPYIDSALGTTSTFRNWRTLLKLVELAAAIAP